MKRVLPTTPSKHRISMAKIRIVHGMYNAICTDPQQEQNPPLPSDNDPSSVSSTTTHPTTTCASSLIALEKTTCFNNICDLHEDILSKMQLYLSGRSIIALSLSNHFFCTFCGRDGEWWQKVLLRKLQKLPTNTLPVSQFRFNPSVMVKKRTYLVMCRLLKRVSDALLFLNNIEKKNIPKCEVNEALNQLDDIFGELGLQIPLKCLGYRLEQDLSSFNPPEDITFNYLPNHQELTFQLNIEKGFYRGERISFVAKLNNYPTSAPTINTNCIPPYHPLINQSGSVDYPLRAQWDSQKNKIEDAILDVRNMFIDQCVLTNQFTL